MKTVVCAALAAALAMPALADEDAFEVKPERRALLIEIIEGLGCEVDGVKPPEEFLAAMEEHKFVKDETKAIAGQLFDEGLAERKGAALVLKTEKCS